MFIDLPLEPVRRESGLRGDGEGCANQALAEEFALLHLCVLRLHVTNLGENAVLRRCSQDGGGGQGEGESESRGENGLERGATPF